MHIQLYSNYNEIYSVKIINKRFEFNADIERCKCK